MPIARARPQPLCIAAMRVQHRIAGNKCAARPERGYAKNHPEELPTRTPSKRSSKLAITHTHTLNRRLGDRRLSANAVCNTGQKEGSPRGAATEDRTAIRSRTRMRAGSCSGRRCGRLPKASPGLVLPIMSRLLHEYMQMLTRRHAHCNRLYM